MPQAIQGVTMNAILPKNVRWILVAGLIAPTLLLANGGGPPGGGSMSSGGGFAQEPRSPEEMARSAYNDGVRAVKQADKYEAGALQETRDDRKAKAMDRAQKQYEKARSYFAQALAQQASLHEAWNYMGYTSRKLGDADKALVAYAEALRLHPGYPDAIEYRGVAYLALNRIDEAKGDYMTLLASDRKLADKLMAEMQAWVAARRSNPAGVSAEQLDSFAQWVTERAAVAQQTASLGTHGSTTAWN
jgi:tetratricopeptide (TPR) repeat protein